MTVPDAVADGAAPMTGVPRGSTEGFEQLIRIGIALSAERNLGRLLESILIEAKTLSGADGGTLYLRTEENTLKFAIMRTDSLGYALGGTTGRPIDFSPLPLFDAAGEENHQNVATHVALTGNVINIRDVYQTTNFDFTGTKAFDAGTGYRSRSFLTVPLKNHVEDVIGVLQLINAQDPAAAAVVPFDSSIEPLIRALASQAAVALDNQQLLDEQRRLLDSFIELIAGAIDAKSPYTGGHCQRVPVLTDMLAQAACDASEGPLSGFCLSEEDRYELHIAAWLHDCGKVTTPEYVVDKATKLETLHNRIHEIRTRFEVAKRDVEIDCLRALLAGAGNPEEIERRRVEKLAQLDEDFAFIASRNIGGEAMSEADAERIHRIAQTTWTRTLDDRLGLSLRERLRVEPLPARPVPCTEHLLADKAEHLVPWERPPADDGANGHGFHMDIPRYQANLGEIHNLNIARGTLTEEERYRINDHIVQTILMLKELPFPRHLRRVPEYAGGHHEAMDGTGYPRGLVREDMSVQARMMAIADIFEALTAGDRPYKKAKTLSESLRIMARMRDEQKIDADLFALFLKAGVYRAYAEHHLMPDQLDEVDVEELLRPVVV